MKTNYMLNVLLMSVFLLMGVCSPVIAAEPAGTVTHTSGPIAARKGDGSLKSLSVNSAVDEGDFLITEKRTYARVKFRDNSEVTLKPNTQFKVEQYGFSKDKPGEDKAVYSLVKGGLRAVTGQIGKRGDPDSYKVKTPTATIGVRGTTYTADYIAPDDVPVTASLPVLVAMAEGVVMSDAVPVLIAQHSGLAPGLYVHVIDGLVQLSNRGGTQQFAAGQFGFSGSIIQPPVIVPSNPGLQFAPPPSFSSSVSGGARSGSSGGRDVKNTDCEVR